MLGNPEMQKKFSTLQNDSLRRVGSVHGKSDVDRVGVVEQNYGFGMGKAPKESKPTTKQDGSLVNVDKTAEDFLQPTAKADADQYQTGEGEELGEYDEEPRDKNELFKLFKESEGKEYVEGIQKNIQDQKVQKQSFKELSDNLEILRNEINKLKEKLDKKHQAGEGQDNEFVDEEEFNLIRMLKECKKNHRNLIEKTRIVKSTIHQLDLNIKSNKLLLVKKFEEHLQKKYHMKLEEPLMQKLSEKDKSTYSKSSDQMDPDAMAFIRAKQKFNLIQQARKNEKMRGQSPGRNNSPMSTRK